MITSIQKFLYFLVLSLFFFAISCNQVKTKDKSVYNNNKKDINLPISIKENPILKIDTLDYNKRMIALSNNDTTGRWPVKKTPFPFPLLAILLKPPSFLNTNFRKKK